MNVLTGLHNFLQFVNDNWGLIAATALLAMAVFKKIVNFFSKSDEEKIAIAKQQIQETMLKLVTKAEKDYLTWVSAGEIKRSEVIDEIFKKYPVLSKVSNQEELVAWIDEVINEALKKMRKIFEEQNAKEKETKETVEG